MNDPNCEFCKIVAGSIPTAVVYRDRDLIAFLDNRPLFPGHVLVCPVEHYETLADLPPPLLLPMMRMMQAIARAVQNALDADGSFVAINNRISQSVPHLHVHIVPRRKKDGLRGFFWPRQKYRDSEAREAVRIVLELEIQRLLS